MWQNGSTCVLFNIDIQWKLLYFHQDIAISELMEPIHSQLLWDKVYANWSVRDLFNEVLLKSVRNVAAIQI